MLKNILNDVFFIFKIFADKALINNYQNINIEIF
jgi:hypothetical protein